MRFAHACAACAEAKAARAPALGVLLPLLIRGHLLDECHPIAAPAPVKVMLHFPHAIVDTSSSTHDPQSTRCFSTTDMSHKPADAPNHASGEHPEYAVI